MTAARKRSTPASLPQPATQRGGFAMGLIVGLLIGLALALAVALYVAKVPSPFVNKVPQRTADQDAAEAEKNRNWDPNTPLYGKNPARPSSAAASGVLAPFGAAGSGPGAGGAAPSGVGPAPTTPTFGMAPPAASVPSGAASAASSARDPAAILAGRSSPRGASSAVDTGVSAPRSGTDPFVYFLQVGAYSRTEDAEEQRARVSMMGFGAKVYEREQAGRTVFRVRVGPYDRKEDADTAKERLDAASIESALVRVQK